MAHALKEEAQVAVPKDIFKTFVDWLVDNGAKFPHLYFRSYTADHRGVHCREDIPRNQRIMYVPLKCLITDKMARESRMGRMMMSIERRLSAPEHNQLMVYLLEDMSKTDPPSFHKPYYDVLPQDASNFPVFWTDEELSYLKGSTLPREVEKRRKVIRKDYDVVCERFPDFSSKYSFQKFMWCRHMVGSRNFTITVAGAKRFSLVPQADMLNHYRPRQTSWTFENSLNCFTITSLKKLLKGQQVMDSYGKKCNSKFLLHYGFAVELNREENGDCMNEVEITLSIDPKDPLYSRKLALKPFSKIYRVTLHYESDKSFAALEYARVAVATAEELNLMRRGRINVVSARNEVAAIAFIANVMWRRLQGYPTSWAQDAALRRSNKLKPYSNRRNALVVMMCEKEVCHTWIQCSKISNQLLNTPMQDRWLYGGARKFAYLRSAALERRISLALTMLVGIGPKHSSHVTHIVDEFVGEAAVIASNDVPRFLGYLSSALRRY